MEKNAIILAAGKSKRFAPFTYEKPKGLFNVKGEYLIERQIKQLKEAGIDEIVIVVGFMKEKFFYLEEKYGVKLVINNLFESKGNLYSLYTAREFLKNSYICCADHYFTNNIFLEETKNSYRACVYKEGKFNEFAISVSEAEVITDFSVGGENALAMVGHAYFNEKFSEKVKELMEKEINDFGVSNMFWEEFWARHQKQLTLYAKEYEKNNIYEFDSVEDLIDFDNSFLENIDSEIVKNICSILNCNPIDIEKIQIIQKGLTNVSFKFTVNNIDYVYRHPGATAGNLVNRKAEVYAQNIAKKLEIDKSVIHIDITGWKLSYYIQDLVECNLEKNINQMKITMEALKKLHEQPYDSNIKKFDTYEEAIKLMKIASKTKGNLLKEFSEIIVKADKIDKYLKNDGYYKLALCHNDTYAPNFLFTKKDELYMIDWEYAGINDRANDIAAICCRYNFTKEEIERYLITYFGRELTEDEHRHYIGAIALGAFYWFCWGLYKGSVNDDDGFYFLTTYRNCKRFMDEVIKSYSK